MGKHYPSVRLGRLEAFVCDLQRNTQGLPEIVRPPDNAARVAVVGSGPAGLAAAEWLIKNGRRVTVFDKNARPGGALAYSIPRFRLPLEVLEDKIQQLEHIGVEFVTGIHVGRDIQFEDIFSTGYQAILLSTGAGVERGAKLSGTDLMGVWQAQDFLMQTNLEPHYWPEATAASFRDRAPGGCVWQGSCCRGLCSNGNSPGRQAGHLPQQRDDARNVVPPGRPAGSRGRRRDLSLPVSTAVPGW